MARKSSVPPAGLGRRARVRCTAVCEGDDATAGRTSDLQNLPRATHFNDRRQTSCIPRAACRAERMARKSSMPPAGLDRRARVRCAAVCEVCEVPGTPQVHGVGSACMRIRACVCARSMTKITSMTTHMNTASDVATNLRLVFLLRSVAPCLARLCSPPVPWTTRHRIRRIVKRLSTQQPRRY